MAIITNENIKDFQVNGIWSINGSMKPFKGADDSKSFTLNVKFNNVPVLDIVNKALDPTKIQWVNGPGRTKYDHWKDKCTVDVDFKSPARAPQLSPMEQFKLDAAVAGVDIDDKQALTEYITEQLNKI